MSPSATVLDSSKANATVGALGTSASGKKLKIRKYPEFETLEGERQYRKQHLAAAFRVFADRGFDEGVAGHISVRDPILTDHFWLNPLSQHFATITVSDLELVNEDGQVVIGDEPINAAAFAIHSEVCMPSNHQSVTDTDTDRSTKHGQIYMLHAMRIVSREKRGLCLESRLI